MAAVPSLTVLVYWKDNQPVAHCLEMDFMTTGRSRDRVVAELYDTIREQVQVAVEGNALKRLYQPAPPQYWQRLAEADLVSGRQIPLQYEPATQALHAREIDVKEFSCGEESPVIGLEL